MAKEVVLMKGNEAIARAAIRIGVDGYFGYPITPQSEVLETLAAEKPWETTGMVVLQAESEVSSINMVYGGACTGKRVMTSSSSPGISLMAALPTVNAASFDAQHDSGSGRVKQCARSPVACPKATG